MKIRTTPALIVVNIIAILLLIVVFLFPNTIFRVVLGLPVVLLFPGYTLISVLFYRRGIMESVERLALSLVLSIAIIPIIGLILSYNRNRHR